MITSLRFCFYRNVVALFSAGLMLSAVGCNSSNLMTYAQDARQRGVKEFAAGDYQAAAGSFRSATRQDPRDYKSFYYLGASYDALGSNQQAAQAFQSSLKVMDVTLEGKEDKAFRAKTIDALAVSIAKGHDLAEIGMPQPGKRPAEDAWLRAKVLRYMGDADAALEAYNQAALQAPEDFYIAKDHGLYLAELGQTETADAQLRRAYRMNPKDPEVADALMRVGTVPGPALKKRSELARTPIPQGPLPELKMPRLGTGANQPAQEPTGFEPTVQAPRD